ncbi:MAG: hypothetical protein NUV54_01945 [Candidatus Taylorbacteria bacterium]|nr:hypothetical protein [Candidatus Taylorbacteria bacterium]
MENTSEEKLLSNPLDTPELTSGQPEKMIQPDELIKTSADHELKNLFGMTPEEPLRPFVKEELYHTQPSPIAPIQPETVPAVTSKESATPTIAKENKPDTSKKVSTVRFLVGLLLVAVIILTALYIWGGVLQERGVTIESLSTTE